MFHGSRIEIDKTAYHHNIKFLTRHLGKNVVFSSVVKGNAYGHGIERFVPMAKAEGVRHFSVFNANEALRVRQSVQDVGVMIMGMIDDAEVEWAINNEVSFYIFDLPRLEAALKFAQKSQKPAMVHFEVETGMYRTGMEEKELEKAIEIFLKNRELLKLEGFCTHFSGAESDDNRERIAQQIAKFKYFKEKIAAQNVRPRLFHTACSAASLRYPETNMDMVRIGIAQYGFWPNEETKDFFHKANPGISNPLKRLLCWKSKVMSFKTVPKGAYVGYGLSYKSEQDLSLAAVPLGYANGFSRVLSNKGAVLINGQKAPVVGMVNMNMVLVKIEHIPNVKRGQEVTLIGQEGEEEISVASFGDSSNSLNYELLTRIPLDIPREVVG